MKTKVFALALASLFGLGLSAQEVTTSSKNLADQPANKVTFQRNAAGDNWFISLRGGINYGHAFTSTKPTATAFGDRMGYGASVGLGKWYTPYFASRVMVDWNRTVDQFLPLAKGNKSQMFHTLNPHLDFMFSPINYFGVYKADRVVDFVPYVGVGAFARRMYVGDANAAWLAKNNYAVSANIGFDLSFRLAKAVELVVAPSVVFTNLYNSYNRNQYYVGNDMLAKLDLGFNFNLGKSDFEVIEPMDYALLNNLQSEINTLRSQNTELSKRPVRCPECPELPEVVETVVKSQSVVYFRIGSAKVDRNQMINIFNTAEFVKANNVPVTVVGYADAKTGSAEFNLQLSEKRAREVARLLTDEYGVPSSQITIDYKGASVQPYDTNAWNRVVIMTAEK